MTLWECFDRIVVFDTETTGLDFKKDRIIELGAICLKREREAVALDVLVRLPEGLSVPPDIVKLTGITDEQLRKEGVEQKTAVESFCHLLQGGAPTLLVAYNAQFDLNFLYGFLRPFDQVGILKSPRFLDLLTVYKDRREYPHQLCNAIDAYGLGDTAVNSHRAIDDARAALQLLEAMAAERDDLAQYIDLFGIHPKYGVSGRRISSVTYWPQSYQRVLPLYKLAVKAGVR